MRFLRRLKGPDVPAFREVAAHRPRPRALWHITIGNWIALLYMLGLGAVILLIYVSVWFDSYIPKSLKGPVTITLLLVQQAPVWINYALILRTRKRVRQANFLACPNCLFDLSDLTETDRCPECGFEFRSLDIPAAWKSVFQWSLGKRATNQEGY